MDHRVRVGRRGLRFASLWVVLVALGARAAAAPARAGEDELRLEIERLGWDLTEKQRVPGVAVALVRAGALAWVQGCGYADLESGREVGEETVFNIGSISKTVAAWGLMRLVEERELALDAPVRTKRWTLPASEFDSAGVTLERLLSHTAGLTLHGYPGFWPPRELPTLEASLAGDTNGAGDVRLEAPPGTRWKYSGGGYTLAQLLLEETAGTSFAEYMRANVLEPLGMKSSAYGWPAEILERSATPYALGPEPLPRGGPLFPELAAAGLQTTAADLARFAAASLPRFRPAGAPAVLAPETIERMQTPVAPASDYGLGYDIRVQEDVRIVGHGGANEGWMARLSIAPESGDAIVILTNGTNGNAVIGPIERAWIAHLAAARRGGGAAAGH